MSNPNSNSNVCNIVNCHTLQLRQLRQSIDNLPDPTPTPTPPLQYIKVSRSIINDGGGILVFDTVDEGTTPFISNHNTATGIFTVPEDGIYNLSSFFTYTTQPPLPTSLELTAQLNAGPGPTGAVVQEGYITVPDIGDPFATYTKTFTFNTTMFLNTGNVVFVTFNDGIAGRGGLSTNPPNTRQQMTIVKLR